MLLDMPREHLPHEMLDRHENALTLLELAVDEARRLISGQRPMILDERGLMAAIEHLVCERRAIDGPRIAYEAEVSFDRLTAPLETAVFRVVQEALNNAERHSRGSQIHLRVSEVDDNVRVEVRDDGVGFDPATIGHGCFGLEGLRERARIFRGTSEIQSTPGQGTRITVEFPIVLRAVDDEAT